jgi:hypothetical protein
MRRPTPRLRRVGSRPGLAHDAAPWRAVQRAAAHGEAPLPSVLAGPLDSVRAKAYRRRVLAPLRSKTGLMVGEKGAPISTPIQ